ncbi:AAA family ATPase [Mycobacterium sp. Aquia_213]|uniref:AAA family ATPase n=1 Tax=Mycobacterium sp. Aquia_213 TaxID=2991728 RepID=UPI002271F18A|nr:AAA family ATPase [Mycobacterium sp. Aquia_213]WAC89712.1 AAA family ATPase [Mycobacterium sp. Aquia_213]
MRVTRLVVRTWRNLRDVDLQVDPTAPLVCLVGENGTGKSAILELLSTAAHQFGIAQGVEMARGDPFEEEHDIEVVVLVPRTDLAELPEHLRTRLEADGEEWNGELHLKSRRVLATGANERIVTAGGVSAQDPSAELAHFVMNQIRQRLETQHLYLDADRAYPPIQIEPHRLADIYQQQWENPEFTRQWSHRPTRTLYEEWIKYFIGVEERTATQHITGIRRARDAGTAEPVFVDPFDSFRDTLNEVLPHLRFVGVEATSQRRTPLFDSAGMELAFSRLSGGEREIAFLVGQLERFRLRRGLLLIDEPELHLNPDLLRNWLAFLRDTVKDGQVWIATHSLEAVEVAGPSSTFVFERDAAARTVTNPTLLQGRPVLSALSAAVGSPAFAISRLRFVYIEGDRQSRERERFYTVCGGQDVNRFLEGGSCGEVLRRLQYLKDLAADTDEQLHIGGVIDRDFRPAAERLQIQAQSPVHVLGCHEIENLYLYPETVAVLLERSGRQPDEARVVVQACADELAGLWVVQHAAARFPKDNDVPKTAMSALSDANKSQLDADWNSRRSVSVAAIAPGVQQDWGQLLDAAKTTYETDRLTDDWYRRCVGKQTLAKLADALEFRSTDAVERQVVSLWNADGAALPPDLLKLREYVNGLG